MSAGSQGLPPAQEPRPWQTPHGSYGEVQLENEYFRVTRWTIAPGGHIPMHTHEHEYVVIPLADGTMHIENADGSTLVSEIRLGASYSRPAGSRHTIANRDATASIEFTEVERLS